MTRRRPTIGELLAFGDEDYRFYTAIHEIGHAASGLATGNVAVDRCVLTIKPKAQSDARTVVRWAEDDTEQRTRLVLLHGGLLAQVRWMKEHGLWTAERCRAAVSGARHDIDAIEELSADEAAVQDAGAQSEWALARLWPGVMAAARILSDAGQITGDQLCDVLNRVR
ncbi:hypothetical protein AB0942_09690 [Streptomyces nodosus]|uniref:hypothetical protein n=1 Tax=Streptomyces nodosus TaxID=40318 RepID=UPI003453F65E